MVDAAAILAGGRSRRMGTDKVFIEVDGVPLGVRTARIIEQCNVNPIYMVGNDPRLQELGFPVLSDGPQPLHPLSGVAAALKPHVDGWVLILPCDLVNLQHQHVRSLLDQKGPCVARVNGQIHPLVGLFPGSLAADAAHLATTGGSAMQLVSDFLVVDLSEPFLVDANVPEQLPR